LTEDLRAGLVKEAPQGYLTMYQAMRRLGVSRQTVLQRVKRGRARCHSRHARKEERLADQGDTGSSHAV
jgi:hypothetical protein